MATPKAEEPFYAQEKSELGSGLKVFITPSDRHYPNY
jgi:hypothetical protein